MCDLETLDVLPTGLIMSIGAVAFDPLGNEMGETFYTVINIDDCVKSGLSVSQSTVGWWMKQSPEAQKVMVEARETDKTLLMALTEFSRFFKDNKLKYLWGNGAAFDNAMLSHAYSKAGIIQPWLCWHDMCFRTLKNINADIESPPRFGTYHNALDDSITQALWCQKIFQSWEE